MFLKLRSLNFRKIQKFSAQFTIYISFDIYLSSLCKLYFVICKTFI